MVEIKEPKPADMSKTLEDSVHRLHELERRIQGVQNHLSTLSNFVQAFPGVPPAGIGIPGPMAPLGVESPGNYLSLPRAAGPPPGGLFFGSPFASTPYMGSVAGVPRAGVGIPASPPIAGMGFHVGGTNGETFSARDLEKLPAVQRAPEVNLVDSGDNYLLQVELPGVKKDDLEITATDRTISIQAEARWEGNDGTVLVGEVVPVSYRRTVHLPTAANSSQSKATLKDGFLTLRVPKKEPTEGPRRVSVAYS